MQIEPTPARPPRIVCTKCVRIVHVHIWEWNGLHNDAWVATECCERIFGALAGRLICDGSREATTDDIVRIGDLDGFATERMQHAEYIIRLADAAKWAEGKR